MLHYSCCVLIFNTFAHYILKKKSSRPILGMAFFCRFVKYTVSHLGNPYLHFHTRNHNIVFPEQTVNASRTSQLH